MQTRVRLAGAVMVIVRAAAAVAPAAKDDTTLLVSRATGAADAKGNGQSVAPGHAPTGATSGFSGHTYTNPASAVGP